MKRLTTTIYLLATLFFLEKTTAQSRFGGGVVAGFNASQMDGDSAAGYHKVGLNIGLRGTIRLNDDGRWLLSTELLYSQRGSRSTENDYVRPFSATLNYIEIPVMISLCDWSQTTSDGSKYYKIHFTAGASYGRLIGTNITNVFTHPPEAIEKFNKSDFSYTLGVSYFVNRHWGFTWRYTQSVNYLFDPKDYPSEPNFDRLYALKGYFFTVQTCWLF